jgi:hypothetical protein
VGDVIAWCLPAAVVILVTGTKSNADHGLILCTVPYVALMFFVARPQPRKVAAQWTATTG